MSYCLNPACPHPQNSDHAKLCKACGAKLLLLGRYYASKTLGRGGFGATFFARDLSLPGQPCCVIKQLRPPTTVTQVLQMARELFEREAQTLGKIGNHPQVPALLNYFEDNQQFYLVEEYVSGQNLQQEVKKNGTYSEAGVKQFLSEILPMLQYIHSQEVIHRDIKPANVIRREQDRRLVLIDFGAVKNQVNPTATIDSADDQSALTAFAVGTLGFAPPEQLARRPVYASDIYAIGVTCVYLLTGKSPKELNYNSSTGEIVWQESVPHLSAHFITVLKKMLEVSVRDRYQSAEEVLRALDLEPYLDSLAQGLVSQANQSGKSSNNSLASGDLDLANSPSSPSSATSQLAMAIRARRARKEQQTSDSSYVSGMLNRSSIRKLDAAGVLTAYLKDRRDFAQQDLSFLNLQQANLSGGIFYQSHLRQINLQGADLSNADFGRADLSQAILRDASLGQAYLSYTNLEGADLRGADLSFANLNYANLKRANLRGANLTNAKVSEEQLAQAKMNWATILPSGKRNFW